MISPPPAGGGPSTRTGSAPQTLGPETREGRRQQTSLKLMEFEAFTDSPSQRGSAPTGRARPGETGTAQPRTRHKISNQVPLCSELLQKHLRFGFLLHGALKSRLAAAGVTRSEAPRAQEPLAPLSTRGNEQQRQDAVDSYLLPK